MGIIATAAKHLIAAGITGAALILAIEEMESHKPIDTQAERRRAADRERKRNLRNSAGSADSASPNGFDGFPDPSLTSLTPIKEKPPIGGQKKVTLDELSVDHIA